MVLGDIEANAGQRRQAVRPMKLKAGKFDGEHIVSVRVPDGIQHRGSDVPDGDGAFARGLQHRFGQPDRRRLTVGACDRQPWGRRPPLALAQPPGKFDVAPNGDARFGRGRQQWIPRTPSRRCHHQLRRTAGDVGQRLSVLGTQENFLDPDDFERIRFCLGFSVRCGIDDDDLGAQLGQRVRCGKTRHANPGNDDAQPGPVGVPAGQLRQSVGTHSATSHSA